MIVAVTGSTGLVGSALVFALEANGHVVRRVVRREVRDAEREIHWKPSEGTIDAEKFRDVDAVVHLAGKNVACRWTTQAKQDIRDSRVNSTDLLARTLAGLDQKPRVLCTASAIGFYGDRNAEVVDEHSTAGEGYLADVCQQWEAANKPAWEAGIRVAQVRIGVVLSSAGGALKKMLPAFKLGMGGPIGSGEQFMSWIALNDVVGAIQCVVQNESVHGAVNLVAPEPVTNRQFTKTLGRVLNRPTIFPMPAFAARLAFGQMADEVLLASTRVAPQRLQETGYQFRYRQLEPALRHLLAT